MKSKRSNNNCTNWKVQVSVLKPLEIRNNMPIYTHSVGCCNCLVWGHNPIFNSRLEINSSEHTWIYEGLSMKKEVGSK